MAKKIALGKGIASLIKDTPNEILSKTLKEKFNPSEEETQSQPAKVGTEMVHIDSIKTNPNQPRKIFKDKELQELSLSIKENGIIQPLIVAEDNGKFELVAGERRLRASKLAGLEYVPVVIKRGTEREKMIMSIIENVQRSDLNCVEEALAYYHLMTEYELTQEDVAKKLGKERSSVANFLRILKLPREVVELIQKEELSFGHAKVLASVKDREEAIRAANRAIVDKLSVRELEKLVKRKNKSQAVKPVKPLYDENKLDKFRQRLEKNTGFHFGLSTKGAGNGQFVIKFTNEAEFNDIYEFLLSK
jgi:ParB family transcriptional regulator, chromosome partitioning protein